ncbi:hypothetical protein [Dysgonomonas mossii]|uniref:hypothetical protein n=1 Tax=Dysgonomonas mossii TaxID=163665 RepID=UPI003994CA94
MKYLFFTLSTILIFSSCSSTFFYSTLNTPNEYVEKVDNGDFLLETDSLWIAYCFKGQDGPVQITVFNKSDKPLYVDWGKSALIIDNVATTYSGEEINYSGDWNSTINSNTSSWGSFSGAASLPKSVSFVPPQTMVSEIPLILSPKFDHINKKSYKNATMGGQGDVALKVRRRDFDQTDTPLAFKSYLTIYSQPDKPMVFEQDFYLSSLIRTEAKPSEMFNQLLDRGDLFYVEKPANNDALYTTLGIIGGAGLIVVGVMYGEPEKTTYYDDY